MTYMRFPPPPSQRISPRLAGLSCSFCHETERDDQFWTGRIMSIQHKRRTICEACVEYADEMAACARLARHAAKAKPGQRRLSSHRRIGA